MKLLRHPLGVLVVLAGLAAAPAAHASDADVAPSDDALLLAAAERAAAAHRRADTLLEKGDPRAAAAALRDALDAPAASGPDGRLVRGELHARHAEVWLLAGDAALALAAARRGLSEERALPKAPTTALLRLREGEALAALGDDAGAVEAYAEVIAVARSLLEERRTRGQEEK